MINGFFKSVSLALAAAMSLASAAVAQSQSPADLRVAYGDLDLSQRGDAWVFKTRMDAAVADWCEANPQVYAGRGPASTDATCRRDVSKLVRIALPSEGRRALQTAARPLTLAAR